MSAIQQWQEASLGKKQDPTSKITRAKRAGVMAHMVESLHSKLKFKPQDCQNK
jgi:hypothetical protein